jgi:hypothetical protein
VQTRPNLYPTLYPESIPKAVPKLPSYRLFTPIQVLVNY